MNTDDRLYGLDGDEYLDADLDDHWERWWDSNDDRPWEEPGWSLEILEWSIAPTSKMLPRAADLLEFLVEHWCEETTEEHYESIVDISQRPEVTEQFENALRVFGRELDTKGWKMADTCVARHIVTYVDGVFFLDGEPTDWRVE